MAADVLIYKASEVPVGVDQEPHLEVMREIARKFNSLYGETFPEPKRYITPGGYMPSLKGTGKMSKSVEGSYINLTDDESVIRKKVASIVTDDGKSVGKAFIIYNTICPNSHRFSLINNQPNGPNRLNIIPIRTVTDAPTIPKAEIKKYPSIPIIKRCPTETQTKTLGLPK